MVSFTRAFFRVSAAVAATLTDPTTTQPELPKPCEGSLAPNVDPVIHLTPNENETDMVPSTSVCDTKKKRHRFRQFRPCKKLAEKARKLKMRIKRRLKALTKKSSLNLKNCPDSPNPVYRLTEEALNSIVDTCENVSSDAVKPLLWQDPLLYSLVGNESDHKYDYEYDIDVEDVFTLKLILFYSLPLNNSSNTVIVRPKNWEVARTQNQFSSQFFGTMSVLFKSLQRYEPVMSAISGINASFIVARLSLFQSVLPFEMNSVFTSVAGGSTLLFKTKSDPHNKALTRITFNAITERLVAALTSSTMPTEGNGRFSTAAGSNDDGAHTSEVLVDRSLESNARQTHQPQTGTIEEITDESEDSEELCYSDDASDKETSLCTKTTDEDSDEEVGPASMVESLRRYPLFEELQMLRHFYCAAPAAAEESSVCEPSVSFSDFNTFITYHGDEAPDELEQPSDSESYDLSSPKSCLKLADLKKSPTSPTVATPFEFGSEWFENLAERFLEATVVASPYNEDAYKELIDNFIAVSQLTFSKLTIGIIEVRSHALNGYATECVIGCQLISEILSISLAIGNRYQVLLEDHKQAKTMSALNDVKKSIITEMKNHCVMKKKLAEAISQSVQINDDFSSAIEKYDEKSQTCVNTVKKVLDSYNHYFTFELNPSLPEFKSEELHMMCGRTNYDAWCANYEIEYFRHAKATASSVINDIMVAVDVLEDVCSSLEESLENFYNLVCNDMSCCH